MTTFPDEVLTRTTKGEIEVRSLIDRGRYVRYSYLHPETGEPMEGGKMKLVLFSESGKTEEYFVIPTKSRRDLLIPAAKKRDAENLGRDEGRRRVTAPWPLSPGRSRVDL